MSIAEGLSGIFEDPSLVSRANTWEQNQTFDGSASFNNDFTYWNTNPVYWDFINNSGPQYMFEGHTQLSIAGSTTGINLTLLNYNGSKNQPVRLGIVPSSSAPAIASGTVYQNTSYSYQTLYIPVYASTAGTAGTAAFALGTSNTPATIFTQYVSGATASTSQEVITVRIPPQWYFSLTVTGATIGTVTQIQE